MAEMEYDDFLEDDDPSVTDVDIPEDKPVVSGPTADEIASWKQAHGMVEQLRTNPEAMRNFIMQQAQAMGLQVQQQQAKAIEPPAALVEQVKSGLAPELHFLAPQLAKAAYAASHGAIAPIRERQAEMDAKAKQSAYEGMAKELTDESPGWEKYEDEMLGILGFLKDALTGNGQMVHNKYGSALKLLYRLAAEDGQATVRATRRMGEAARNATRSSQAGSGRGQGPDLQTMLDNAANPQQKWKIAMAHALREHGVS